ncbi:hypothetical protein GCM10023176_45330 [Micromonospora coerulea]|uniref:Uncharacterized protein n=1 Tax=Micromonospora coerulea TaxID=47856 RepID=A0ABP8SX08_9ACTN
MTAALAPAATLDVADWRARRRAHEDRVDAWLAPHLARRRGGVKHPVEDLLFTYYSHRPAQLRRLRKRNSGTSQRWGVCKRHEADNQGPSR